MRHTRHFFTLAALCVFVGVMAGSALAADPPKTTPPPTPPENLKGVYGGIGAGIGDADDVGWAWRMMVWYRPWEYFSGEIGYADVDAENGDFDGLHLAAVPTIPVRPANMDVLIKVGGFFNEDNHVTAGLGLAFRVYKNVGVRLDWDRLNIEESDGVDIVTLSAFYHLATQRK